MKRFRRSLTTRLVLTAVIAALLGGAATLGVAYQLVRSATIRESHTALRGTAQVVAEAPARERATLVRDLDRGRPRGIQLVLVRDDGSTVPATTSVPAPVLVSSAVRDQGRIRSNGRTFLVERIRASGGEHVVAVQDFTVVRAAVARIADRILAAAALGAVVAAGIGAVVAGRVVRPLRRTTTTARRLAAGERGVSRGPESPIADVAAIDHALGALDEALRTSEGRQREFLLSVSHEIRTPLTGIRGYAEALADGLVTGDAVSDAGRTLATETARLDAFLRDLLELSRLQADDFPIRSEPFDVALLLQQASGAWRATADDAEVTLTVSESGAPGPVVCTSDPMRVRQLLDGLIENALRASPPGGSISIVLGATDRACRITVTDDGPGLTASDAEDAFERGVLANRYRNTRAVGTGLGLSIAARLVSRLGGRLEAVPSDTGAVFAIELPLRPGCGLPHG